MESREDTAITYRCSRACASLRQRCEAQKHADAEVAVLSSAVAYTKLLKIFLSFVFMATQVKPRLMIHHKAVGKTTLKHSVVLNGF